MLKLFVYGTLKRGYWNHDAFCQGVLDIRDAHLRGRLYEEPRFPLLEVPVEDVLAYGTADPLADVATQAHLAERVGALPQDVPESATAGAWGAVFGERLTFDDLKKKPCPPSTGWRDSARGGAASSRRVLVPVAVDGANDLAWVYTVEATPMRQRRIASGCWPE